MAMVRELHKAGYEKLYLYSWPKPSGLHWRWQLFTGKRDWMQRPWREGWYGSGADYNNNPVMGWGDAPGASTDELIHALAKFDPEGLARALGRDEDHTAWFANVCDALLPGYRPSPNPFCTATLTLEPVAEGTRYTALVQHADAATREKHAAMGFEEGWGKALDQLVELMEG